MSTSGHDMVATFLADSTQYLRETRRMQAATHGLRGVVGEAVSFIKNAFSTAFGVLGGNMLTSWVGSIRSGLASFISGGFELATSVEMAATQFEVMIGNAQQARDLVADIKRYADTTVFHFPETLAAARTLMTAGLPVGQVMPTLRKVGDMSYDTAHLSQVSEVFAKIYTKQKITGEELRQFARMGVGFTNELAKSLGKTTAEIYQMSRAGELTYPLFAKTMRDMTSEGGRFYNMQERIARTTYGLWTILQDAWNNVKMAVAEAIIEMFGANTLIDRGAKLAQWLAWQVRQWIPPLVEWAKFIRDNAEPMFWQMVESAAGFGAQMITVFQGIRGEVSGLITEVKGLGKALADSIPEELKALYKAGQFVKGAVNRAGETWGDFIGDQIYGEDPNQTASQRLMARERARNASGKQDPFGAWTESFRPGMYGPGQQRSGGAMATNPAMLAMQNVQDFAKQMQRDAGLRAAWWGNQWNPGSGQPQEQFQVPPYVPPKAKAAKYQDRDMFSAAMGGVGGPGRSSAWEAATKALEELWNSRQDEKALLEEIARNTSSTADNTLGLNEGF